MEVYDSSDSKVALQLLFLDTGGGSLPKQLESNQVQWLQRQRDRSIPMIAFQHIPTKEFEYDGDKCKGLADNALDAIENSNILDALEADGNVPFLAVGHNHGNDYCCAYQRMHLCFGRHTGYGGYGSWNRGARVYEIQIQKTAAQKDEEDNEEAESDQQQGPNLKWKSWVRMESGDVKDKYSPFENGDEDKNWWGDWRKQ